MKELTNENFAAETAGGVSVIDFWATWCGPCRMMAPAFEAVAGKLAGQAAFFKVNIDEAPELAERFGVMSIPTLLVLRGGQPVDSSVGARSEAALEAYVRKFL